MTELAVLALTNLWNRKMRSGLTLLGVAVAVASFVALYTLAKGPERNWTRSLAELKIHLVGYERGVVHTIMGRLPETLIERIRAVPGVVSVAPQGSHFLPSEDERQVVVIGMPVPSDVWQIVPIREGRIPATGEEWVAVLGRGAAEALGKKVGDTVTIMWQRFTVIGITGHENALNSGGILLPLVALQKLTQSQGFVTTFTVQVDRPGDAAAVNRVLTALNTIARNLVFVRSEDITRSSKILQLLQAISWAVSAISVGMGIVVVANTLVMSITERTREIGILGAVGWSMWRIMGMILFEGLLIAVLGGAVGTGLGVVLALWLSNHPVLGDLLEPVFSAGLFLWIGFGVAGMGVVGALYPAWVAGRISPARVLQHE